MNYIIFKLKSCGSEYGVWNKKKQFLGDVCLKGRNFVFYPDHMCFTKEIWFSSSCLKEITNKLEELNSPKV